MLDVGCNEGWLTCEIGALCSPWHLHRSHSFAAQVWGASKVVGVDIDDGLVEAAWRRRRALWSTQGPSGPDDNEESEQDGSGRVAKRRRAPSQDVSSPEPRRNYFPASCEHEFGPLPIPPYDAKTKTIFPHNVSFRAADWVNVDIVEDAAQYDVVVA